MLGSVISASQRHRGREHRKEGEGVTWESDPLHSPVAFLLALSTSRCVVSSLLCTPEPHVSKDFESPLSTVDLVSTPRVLGAL